MNCKEAIPLIHDYMDGDLPSDAVRRLREHLLACPECKTRFSQLEETEALVRMSAVRMKAPDQVTTRIMLSLPPVKRPSGWIQWARKHPAASVAAVFAMVMLSGFLSLWNADTQLIVRGEDLSAIVIEGDTVVVPGGKSVQGDLLVENGKIRVDGQVTGNVVVIDGTVAMASTAKIGGEIRQVDEWIEWVWYKVNHWFSAVSK